MAYVRGKLAVTLLAAVAFGAATPGVAAAAEPGSQGAQAPFAPIVTATRGATSSAGAAVVVVATATERSLVARYARALRAAQVAEYVQALFRLAAARAAVNAADGAVWDRMAQCETGGNWHMHGSSYSGGVGFANSTWAAFGGGQFAANAGDATREQQIVIADRVRDTVGYHAWGCAPAIGL